MRYCLYVSLCVCSGVFLCVSVGVGVCFCIWGFYGCLFFVRACSDHCVFLCVSCVCMLLCVCFFCERDFGVSFVFIRLFSCARLNFGVYVLVVWVSACLFAMLVCMCVFL